jgi:hypothetical protein
MARTLKSAPDIHAVPAGLHPPSYTSWSSGCPAQCRDADSIVHRHEVGSPLPQGSSLLPESCCLEPSSLNRPHAPHSWAHRDFTARRLVHDAFAVRERRGDPRVVPGFRCTVLSDRGEFGHRIPISRCRHGSSPRAHWLDTPNTPAIRFTRALNFAASLVRNCYGLLGCSSSLDGSDWSTSPATGDFYVQAFDGSVTVPVAGYNDDIDWTPMSAGLAPAYMRRRESRGFS